jgi:hypothetical protein
MVIVFVGNGKEYLSAFAQEVPGVDTVIVTSERLESLPSQFANLRPVIKLVIIDANNPPQQLQQGLRQLRKAFPGVRLWAIFDSPSPAIQKELRQLGFNRLLTYQDDLRSLLEQESWD